MDYYTITYGHYATPDDQMNGPSPVATVSFNVESATPEQVADLESGLLTLGAYLSTVYTGTYDLASIDKTDGSESNQIYPPIHS